MPLKHNTETALMILLCAVVMVVAVLTATLPLLPKGFTPSVILMIASGLYWLALFPFLRSNRADYEFRLLHLAPLAIVVIWFVIQVLMMKLPWLIPIAAFLRFAWMLPLVSAFMILLVLFSLKVLRRWEMRVPLFGVLLVLFATLGISNQYLLKTDKAITASLWNNSLWAFGSSSSAVVAVNTSSQSSVLKPGETWEDRLSSDYQKNNSRPVVASGHSSSKPGRLPSAGPAENMMLAVLALTGACVATQKKILRRIV